MNKRCKYEESISSFLEIFKTKLLPQLEEVKVCSKPDEISQMQIVMRINNILNSSLFATPYLFKADVDNFGYGVIMTFAHLHYKWVTRYIHDVTEFTPDEKTIWEAASKDIRDVDCFTIRTLNICDTYNMPIVGSLCRKSKRDLLLCDGCGSVTITNIQEGLKSCGLTVGMSLPGHIRVAISYVEYNAISKNILRKRVTDESNT